MQFLILRFGEHRRFIERPLCAAISAKVASWPDEGSEAASLFRDEMSDRPRVRQCPALI